MTTIWNPIPDLWHMRGGVFATVRFEPRPDTDWQAEIRHAGPTNKRGLFIAVRDHVTQENAKLWCDRFIDALIADGGDPDEFAARYLGANP